ncbi:hypothetical protein FQZ97_977130 [compost metagenome]
MKAPTLAMTAFDSATRPFSLALPPITLLSSEPSKLPNTNGRSKACDAPYTSFHGAASCDQSRR